MFKQLGSNSGQVTIINLLVIFTVAILFLVMLPIIIQFINTYTIPAITSPSNLADPATKDILQALVQLYPVAIIIAIIASILVYAIPQREGVYR